MENEITREELKHYHELGYTFMETDFFSESCNFLDQEDWYTSPQTLEQAIEWTQEADFEYMVYVDDDLRIVYFGASVDPD